MSERTEDKPLKTVATFDTPTAAGFVRSRLEAEDIRVFTENLETVGVAWHLGNAVGGIKLQVFDEDAERAFAVLEDMNAHAPVRENDQPPAAEAHQEVPGRDIDGDEPKPTSASELVNRALRCAILGMLFFPLQIYTLWLVGRIMFGDATLSPGDRTRFVAVLVLVCLIGAAMITILSLGV